jgi:hypothetical protein
VLRSERDRRREVALPLRCGLARDGEDQVEAHVPDPRGARRFERAARVVRPVVAAERAEVARLERLRAERQPVDAGGALAGERVAVDGPRVRLERHLGAGHEAETRATASSVRPMAAGAKSEGVPPPT